MLKVMIAKPGSYDKLSISSARDLMPSPGQVVVEVSAAGVNYADCIVRMGLYKSARKINGYPITPGFEFAGRIAQSSPDVASFAAGEEVFGVTLFNAYATQVAVPISQVFRRPPELSSLQAATFPTAFITAWYAAARLAHLEQGNSVLVHSAAGGVGGALVQVCKAIGCRVVGVIGSSAKLKVAEEVGCDVVIDKTRGHLWQQASAQAPSGYDAVFDANGVSTLRGSYNHLAPMGRLVTYGFHAMLPRQGGRPNRLRLLWDYVRTPRYNPIRMAEANKSVMGFNLSFLFDEKQVLQQAMSELLGWLKQGKIRALPVRTFRFSDVASAHREIESGLTTGKLALVMNESTP